MVDDSRSEKFGTALKLVNPCNLILMTSDLTKEIIVGSLSAFFTAVFTGVPAAALFWWTYMRDQERLVVEKVGPRKLATAARQTFGNDGPNSVLEIVIRNRSLFSVHVSAVGFEIDGEVIAAEHPRAGVKMKKNPNAMSQLIYIEDDSADPWEIPSQASLRVSLSKTSDRNRFTAALLRSAEKQDVSVESLLDGPKVIAMVATESGKLFTSLSSRERVYRRLLQIKKEMDGPSAPSTPQ